MVGALVASLVTVAPVSAAGSLTGPVWSTSTAVTGATATYSYRFTSATGATLTKVTATVPPGTASGSQGLSVLTAEAYVSAYTNIALPGAVASLDTGANLLSVTFASKSWIAAGDAISLDVSGFVNTSTAGSYSATLTTASGSHNYTTVDTGTSPAIIFADASLSAPSWSVTSTVTDAIGVSYTYLLRVATTTTLTTITMSLPPGTGGTPEVGTITPSSAAGGSITAGSGRLTYTLPGSGVPVDSASTLTITITGLTNTGTVASYSSQIVGYSADGSVAAATTPPVVFAPAALTSPSWESTSTSTGSTTTYTWDFTSPGATLTTITMTLPPGTTGTPTLGTVVVYDPASKADVTLAAQTITMTGTVLAFAFTGQYINPGTTFSIGVAGLTTSQTAGTYASNVAALNAGSPVASTSTNSLSFSATTLGTPIWAVSSTKTAAQNVTYTYSFTVSVSAAVASVTMTVPAGTSGSPIVVSASPAMLADGASVAFSADRTELVYTFTSTTIPPGTNASIQIGGLTNTGTGGTYSSAVTVEDSGTVLASAVTTSISFTSSVLTALSWTQSSQATDATDVSYTYEFTTGSTGNLDGVTMTVPIGTAIGANPSITVTDQYPDPKITQTSPLAATVELVGTVLNVYFSATYIRGTTIFTVVVTGMTNTSTPGSYSSAVATMLSGGRVDSGTTPAATFVGGPLVATTWSVSQATAGSDGVAYTFAFTTASTSTLSAITVNLPAGTGGTAVALGATSPALAAGGSVSLSGSTLNYSFTATSIAAGTRLSLQVTGLTNPPSPGAYSATITTLNGTTPIDDGTTAAVAILPQSLVFTNRCPNPLLSCAVIAPGGTGVTLLVVPGGAEVSASVILTVTTDAAHGYVVKAQMSPLSDPAGHTILQAPAAGGADLGPYRFFATATLSPSSGSGATLCPPYGGSTSTDVGYSPAPGTSLWSATAGSGTDTLTLSNTVSVSAVQPAGQYTATIGYTIEPHYTGEAAC